METDIPGSNLTDPRTGPEQAKEMASEDKAAAGISAVQPKAISNPGQDTAPQASSALIDGKPTDDKSSSPRPRGRLQSSKLDSTLAELESAFTDWEDLTAKPSTPQGDSATKEPENEEFKKRTRKLLLQLRQQLREL